MAPKYQSIKKIIVVLPFIFFFVKMNAQSSSDDSVRILTDELKRIQDSVQAATRDGVETDIDPADTSVLKHSMYFTDKRLQVNGGGPDSLQLRKVPDSNTRKLFSSGDFWYVNYIFEKEKKQEQNESFTNSTGFQTILWLIIIGGFAAFVIVYLANSNVGLFRKQGAVISSKEETEMETDNIFAINYQREIDKAIAASNYRFAVRLMFLRVLKNLSDKKVIRYQHDRTNFDYLMQLHSTKYYRDFSRLTRNYEYSWYGQFAIEPDLFTVIKKDFDSFERNLDSR